MARTAKNVNTDVNVNVNENNSDTNVNTENEQLKQLIKQMKAEMDSLKEQIKTPQTIYVEKNNSVGGRKIKLMSLMYNPVNVSTETDGGGRLYEFNKFGETRSVSFDDLTNICASYPNTMKNGLIYICDKDAVAELGLDEDYEKIYTQDVIDKIKYLRREVDADLFIGMNKIMQNSIAQEIAKLMNANESMDFNILKKIKDNTGIDIESLANSIKENSVTRDEAEKDN